eukprot:scaffold79101_cov65-Phaeocystis_antarctica.AAC.3
MGIVQMPQARKRASEAFRRRRLAVPLHRDAVVERPRSPFSYNDRRQTDRQRNARPKSWTTKATTGVGKAKESRMPHYRDETKFETVNGSKKWSDPNVLYMDGIGHIAQYHNYVDCAAEKGLQQFARDYRQQCLNSKCKTPPDIPTAKISHGRFKNAKLSKIGSRGRHGGVKKSTSKRTQPVARPRDAMDTGSNTEAQEAREAREAREALEARNAAAMAAAAAKKHYLLQRRSSLLRGIREINPPDHPLLRRCIRPEWD